MNAITDVCTCFRPGRGVTFRLVYVLDGQMHYQDAHYCSVDHIPNADDLLPHGAQVIEVAVAADGVETCVTTEVISVTVDLDRPMEIQRMFDS